MRIRTGLILVTALLCLSPVVSVAQLKDYHQDFEAVVVTDRFALSSDGWLVYGNVYDPSFNYLYGYGPYDAPNSTANGVADAFSGMATGEGGPSQGLNQVSIFSDYQNADQGVGDLVESNVYHEMTVTAADVGTTWHFEFDAKIGNLVSPTTAIGFIKTLDPGNGYALTNFLQANTTYADTVWHRYGLTITIDAGLEGQVFQFGFANTCTNYNGSSVFYDNIDFVQTASLGAPQGRTPGTVAVQVLGNPAIGNAPQVLSFTVPRDGRVTVRVFDVTGALVATLMDRDLAAGPYQVAWHGRGPAGGTTAPGIYFAEVATGTGKAVARLVRSH